MGEGKKVREGEVVDAGGGEEKVEGGWRRKRMMRVMGRGKK